VAERDDANGDGMLAPNGDRHAADANRNRVAAEWAEVKRLNRHAFVKAEMLKAASLAFVESVPINRGDARLRSDL
jgi:hypothetical protein